MLWKASWVCFQGHNNIHFLRASPWREVCWQPLFYCQLYWMAVEQMAKFLGNLNQRFRNILWLKQGKCKLSVLNIEKQKKPLCLKKKKTIWKEYLNDKCRGREKSSGNYLNTFQFEILVISNPNSVWALKVSQYPSNRVLFFFNYFK